MQSPEKCFPSWLPFLTFTESLKMVRRLNTLHEEHSLLNVFEYNNYRPPTKLQEGNVFTCVCLFKGRKGGGGTHSTITHDALSLTVQASPALVPQSQPPGPTPPSLDIQHRTPQPQPSSPPTSDMEHPGPGSKPPFQKWDTLAPAPHTH